MNLAPTQQHQAQMRHAHFEGAPGILVSGLVWLVAALVCYQFGVKNGVWTLLIGGALIYPLGLVLAKILGRSGSTDKDNALNQLALASTIWLIVGCAMAYGLYLLKAELFFPAMMATIGSRYLIFASIYGTGVYWILGASLLIAAQLSLFLAFAPAIAAGLGGIIELVFAVLIFAKAPRSGAR